jgi:hypothetical protein
MIVNGGLIPASGGATTYDAYGSQFLNAGDTDVFITATGASWQNADGTIAEPGLYATYLQYTPGQFDVLPPNPEEFSATGYGYVMDINEFFVGVIDFAQIGDALRSLYPTEGGVTRWTTPPIILGLDATAIARGALIAFHVGVSSDATVTNHAHTGEPPFEFTVGGTQLATLTGPANSLVRAGIGSSGAIRGRGLSES